MRGRRDRIDDVAIVGAGPAGSLAAIILARAGLSVTLFDRAQFPRQKLCGDTVNPGGACLLGRHLSTANLFARAGRLDGMLLTGPGRTRVRGLYGAGRFGYAIERRALDTMLVEQAAASGARVEHGCAIDEPLLAGGRVVGVRLRGSPGRAAHRARLVIAADGRHSKLAFALDLARHPRAPRRWAIGAYFADVQGLTTAGEMHVRPGHYLGVAPMPGGLANACLVLPHAPGTGGWRDAAVQLTSHLTRDPLLAPRFASARAVAAPTVLGPLAVDSTTPGAPGLLLAGDAAGFVDPMTGDGLTFAWRGAELAARVALETLSGHLAVDAAARVLAAHRRRAFAGKLCFNRSLRFVVASPRLVNGAAHLARGWPRAFELMIRYAGDVPSAPADVAVVDGHDTPSGDAPPLHVA